MPPASPRSYVPLRRVDWRVVAGLIGLNTLLLTAYRQLDFVASGIPRPVLLTFAEELSGGVAGFLIFPLLYLTAIHYPLISNRWRRNALIHLLALCGISLVHTTIIALVRVPILAMCGFPHVGYGSLPVRYPMEGAHLAIYYCVGLTAVYLFHEMRYARQRELEQVELQRSLAETQLQNLRLQLEPHFLFNALNAISAAIYEDARVADEMIGRLAELLRHLLKEDPSPVIALSREIETLELYARIMQARFENRLKIEIKVDPALRSALVPQLILQPLVENSIRHGMNLDFTADIRIAACREDGALRLTVQDGGSGIDETQPISLGIGLKNIMERLVRLYGPEQSFALRNCPSGGAVAEIRLPLQWA